jgi:hypothetical protein
MREWIWQSSGTVLSKKVVVLFSILRHCSRWSQIVMKRRFSISVERILRESGWFVNRHKALDPSLSDSFEAASIVLEEFYGLHFGHCGAGIECATSDVNIDPRLGEHLADELRSIEQTMGVRLCSLGEVHRGHGYLVIDDQGRTYLLSDNLEPFATSFPEALEKLLLGRKGVGSFTP